MEGRGLTLRSKSRRRPQISAPKPITGPTPPNPKLAAPSLASAPRERPQQSDATSDLVKRRYSTRFNQPLDLDFKKTPLPSIPQDAGDYSGLRPPTSGKSHPSDSSEPLRVDLKALRDPSLPAEKYVANLLASASEQEIQNYQESLRKVKNRTSTDLQQNVYQNRTQFIKISKEAEKLKGEMRTLRTLMSELTAALGQTNIANGLNPLSPSLDERATKRANRSSVANLETMWNVQLQALWKTIEGSQKFLPALPGRHVVLDSGHWVQLDSATWKPKRPVHIVLLNDHLLVAAKKRKRVDQNGPDQRGPAPTKLVADECWQLQDIDMIDLGANLGSGVAREEAEERGVTNAINIRFGANSYTYRHDQRSTSAKNELLTTFRKTVEDLRKTLRIETEATSKPNESMSFLDRRDASIPRKSDLLDGVDSLKDKPEVLIDVDGKQQNLRWVEWQLDELDIAIALQHFEDAVSAVERLRKLSKSMKGNAIAQDVIIVKIDERARKVAGMVSRGLVDKHSFSQATKTNIAWLSRLGFEDRAREAYLHARTEVILKRVRQCIFEGDLPLYIFQICFVYFTLIKNTIGVYQQCFPPAMTSACIKWAKDHLGGFNAILVRQLSSVQRGTGVWQKCMDIVNEHAAMLTDVGVDFRNLIGIGLDIDRGATASCKE